MHKNETLGHFCGLLSNISGCLTSFTDNDSLVTFHLMIKLHPIIYSPLLSLYIKALSSTVCQNFIQEFLSYSFGVAYQFNQNDFFARC